MSFNTVFDKYLYEHTVTSLKIILKGLLVSHKKLKLHHLKFKHVWTAFTKIEVENIIKNKFKCFLI